MDKLNMVRGILGTESIRETINAALSQVIRIAATRDLVALGEAGAFDFLLEPGAEERMWRLPGASAVCRRCRLWFTSCPPRGSPGAGWRLPARHVPSPAPAPVSFSLG
jgi:hypothetical protein